MAIFRNAATSFMALTGQNEPCKAEWENDYHLLTTTAYLAETTPHALLRKISAKPGDILSLRDLQTGQALPIMSKVQLQRTLDERMRIEQEIIESACCDSQKLASVVLPHLLLIGTAALLLI